MLKGLIASDVQTELLQLIAVRRTNLGETWRLICSPDIRSVSTLAVFVIALCKSTFTYLLTYLHTRRPPSTMRMCCAGACGSSEMSNTLHWQLHRLLAKVHISCQLALVACKVQTTSAPDYLCSLPRPLYSSGLSRPSDQGGMAPCGLRGCRNRAHSVSWQEVVKDVPNQGLDCFVS